MKLTPLGGHLYIYSLSTRTQQYVFTTKNEKIQFAKRNYLFKVQWWSKNGWYWFYTHRIVKCSCNTTQFTFCQLITIGRDFGGRMCSGLYPGRGLSDMVRGGVAKGSPIRTRRRPSVRVLVYWSEWPVLQCVCWSHTQNLSE